MQFHHTVKYTNFLTVIPNFSIRSAAKHGLSRQKIGLLLSRSAEKHHQKNFALKIQPIFIPIFFTPPVKRTDLNASHYRPLVFNPQHVQVRIYKIIFEYKNPFPDTYSQVHYRAFIPLSSSAAVVIIPELFFAEEKPNTTDSVILR